MTKTYPSPDGGTVTALSVDDFWVDPGEIVAIVGSSGSGKSTLLHALAGIVTLTAGELVVAGRALHALGERARDHFRAQTIGMVFQSFNLLAGLTAHENVAVALQLAGTVPAKLRRERADELLDRVGLADRRSHRPGQLSTGQQQRVALARALANRPRIVLADEPTAHLDDENAVRLMDLLIAECRESGTALVLATHDPVVIERLRPRVVRLTR